jgi:hypothetical protein
MNAEQSAREAQGWTVSIYNMGSNQYKIVVIRPISGGGVNANLFIVARYSYAP